MINKLIIWIMARFFRLLYNQFSCLYDFVAGFVSTGRWTNWVYSILEQIKPVSTLELGVGPGHLQKRLHQHSYPIFGLDISRNMIRRSSWLIKDMGYSPRLIQASSLAIPIADHSFHQVICTFPSDYIFQSQTLAEIHRVLEFSGKLVILLGVRITGKSLHHKILNLIYQITGQSPDLKGSALADFTAHFNNHGFDVQSLLIENDFYSLTYLIAGRTES